MTMENQNGTSAEVQASDRNEVVLRGKLATAPEHRTFGSGASLARLLVTVRLASPLPGPMSCRLRSGNPTLLW